LGLLLSALYDLMGQYGFTLIVFTLIVRGCLFPLYASQLKSTARMAEVQPKIQELQKRYAGDKETLNAKMMDLYKAEKFNPLGGCLPLLIQLPIIWGLFSLLRNPTVYLTDTGMWAATHEAFFWIQDLSQPDPWILPILAGVCTYFSTHLTQSQQNPAAASQMGPMMNMMKYVFPVMIVWMGRSFPAGLALYWFVGTLIQVGQTLIFNKWRKKLMVKRS
jgi:YidC/Oxa1 family membrane protein insertase